MLAFKQVFHIKCFSTCRQLVGCDPDFVEERGFLDISPSCVPCVHPELSISRLCLTVWWTPWRMCSTSWSSTCSSCLYLRWWLCSFSRDASFTALTNPKSLNVTAGEVQVYTYCWRCYCKFSINSSLPLKFLMLKAYHWWLLSGANIFFTSVITKWRRRSGNGRSTISTTTMWLGPSSPSSLCLLERGGRSE